MHFSNTLSTLSGVMLGAASLANAAYVIQDTYDSTNFFTSFDFFSTTDPTHGFVQYTSAKAANASSLAGYSNNAVYLGVDYTTPNPTGGRASTRVTSQTAYTHGLFIADISHMPGSICGVWPAFWTVGGDWPNNGEIDIIEGVNKATTNTATLHTSSGCTMTNGGALSTSTLGNSDCNSNNAYNGCGFTTGNTQAYGDGFNAVNGGVHAMLWTSTGISTYFFPRNAIPSDITSGSPDPTTWGTPVTSFTGSGCSIDGHFKDHQIVFDTTFCGDWAGSASVWAASQCSSLATSCQAYVAANPSAFAQAYWLVNSVKVYKNSAAAKREEGVAVPFLA